MSSEDGAPAAAPPAAAPPLTLDDARDAFYVAQRACERFALQLKGFVELLDSKKAQADEAWIEAVQEEARRVLTFHSSQHAEWDAFSERTDAYVDSVRRLAERMAIAELKGETLPEAELPENRARTVHPELQRFKLEKRARILGRMGGVPALGGMVMPALPASGAALRATGSAAAREINYSKVEGRDARYLANVMQFRANAAPEEVRQQRQRQRAEEEDRSQWQQEASAMLRRREEAEKAEEELNKQKASPFGEELSGVLQQRHAALRQKEQEDAAAAASAFRRGRGAGAGGSGDGEGAELADATPELAAKLQRRKDEAARAAKAAAEAAAEAAKAAAAGGGGDDDTPSWHDASAFGGELAAALQRRNASKSAAAAAAPAREEPRGGAAAGFGPGVDSELAQRLRRMQERQQQE